MNPAAETLFGWTSANFWEKTYTRKRITNTQMVPLSRLRIVFFCKYWVPPQQFASKKIHLFEKMAASFR
jgi:hypothetical protein